jgi:hypothetical protein
VFSLVLSLTLGVPSFVLRPGSRQWRVREVQHERIYLGVLWHRVVEVRVD